MSTLTEKTSEFVHQQIDRLEHAIVKFLPPVETPVEHNHVPKGNYCPGFYLRTIFMPRGTVLTSKIHKTRHPYMIHTGKVKVMIKGARAETLAAGHVGVTEPGTRRTLLVIEDCTWTTFHPTAETNLERLEAELIEPRETSLANKDRRQLCRGQQSLEE